MELVSSGMLNGSLLTKITQETGIFRQIFP